MKDTLKILVPIAVLVGVVFGVTFFSRYTPPADDGPAAQKAAEPPLRFFSTARHWDPRPEASLQDQCFPGFYEVQADAAGLPNSAAFMFENRNRAPVVMQLARVSCTSCSGGRVAAIPPAAAGRMIRATMRSAWPGAWFGDLPAALGTVAAEVAPDRLDWQGAAFKDDPHASFKFPAAGDNPDGFSPRWGVIELQFSVGALGPKQLSAEFGLQVEGSKETSTVQFNLACEGVDPFGVSARQFDAGDLDENAEPRKYELMVFSSTRGPTGSGPGDLRPPVTRVDLPAGSVGEPGPFVSVGDPVRVPTEELEGLSIHLSNQAKKPIRVESAYRLTVTLSPKVGDRRIDIGPFERDVWVSLPDAAAPRAVPVKAQVSGPAWLDDGRKDIALNDRASAETAEKYSLVTQKPDAEVAVVRGETRPDWMGVALKKLPPQGDRGYYEIAVTVPPGKAVGTWTGLIVLELKGPNPQRIRIPVRGKGLP